MGEAREAQEFEMQLERWSGSCVVCRMGLTLKDSETQHGMARCLNRDGERWCWISDAMQMTKMEGGSVELTTHDVNMWDYC